MAMAGGSRDGQDIVALTNAVKENTAATTEDTEAKTGGGSPALAKAAGVSQRDNDIAQMAKKRTAAAGSPMQGFGPGLRATAGGRALTAGAGRAASAIGAMSSAGGALGLGVGAALGAAKSAASVAGVAARTFADDTVTFGEKQARFAKYAGGAIGGDFGANIAQAILSKTGVEKAMRVDRSARSGFRGAISSMVALGTNPTDTEIKQISGQYREHYQKVEAIMTKQKNLPGETDSLMGTFTGHLRAANPLLDKFVKVLEYLGD